jgi:hypothetical protein
LGWGFVFGHVKDLGTGNNEAASAREDLRGRTANLPCIRRSPDEALTRLDVARCHGMRAVTFAATSS